ncbi:TetR-like C-terminal domain-containing protein [Pseudalkalibacillus hwajinpoensis]|uniref:TetR/AcrR family transcriptional regulator n=1 Tax=Guptibacillus hwajinpoensis TaxID=208199 RepID=UPI00325C10D1
MAAKGKITQDLIICEALQIADCEGVAAVTMATLARQLSIKPPSLYNHFAGLDQIRKGMALLAMNHMFDKLVTGTAGKNQGNEKIHALSESYISFAREHPGMYESTLLTPDAQDHEVQEAGNKIVSLTMDVFIHFKLDEVTHIHVVRALRSMLHGLVDLQQKGGFQQAVDLEDSRRVMVEMLIRGIEV